MESQAPPSSRRRTGRRIAGYVLPGAIVAAVGIGSHLLEARLGPMPWLMPAALTVVLLISARLMVMWWNQFDEVAKEAHRESWFWGGSAGFGVSVILLVGVTNYADALNLADVDPVDLFTVGAASVFLPVFAGYLIWWAAWWLRRR